MLVQCQKLLLRSVRASKDGKKVYCDATVVDNDGEAGDLQFSADISLAGDLRKVLLVPVAATLALVPSIYDRQQLLRLKQWSFKSAS